MPSTAPSTTDPSPAATRPLRAGIIGLGVGEAHIPGYQGHPAGSVTAICDFDADKLAEVAARHPCAEPRDRAEHILDDPDIDVVSIASYDNHHYEQVVRALENGKHVFVEKPICLTQTECRHIRRLLDAKPDLQLSSNLVLRCCPRFKALKTQIERGELGELFLVEGDYHYGRLHKITEGWRGAIDFYSVVYGGAIHIVDLLHWLTDDTIVEVAAAGNQIASKGSQFRYNDTVTATVKFAGGLIGKVGVSYGCVRPHFHGLEVYGTAGTFINGQPDAWLYTSRDPNVEPRRISDAYPGVQKGDLIASFLNAILHQGPAIVDKEDVFRTMSVCLAIEKAVAAGTTCPVEMI